MLSSAKENWPTIIGLTGGIGMGKSTVAGLLSQRGYPIYSADDAVHALLRKGGRGVGAVSRLFPDTLKGGAIDRAALAKKVFGRPTKLRQLEKIIHPLLQDAENAVIAQARKLQARAVILEIPLLFETGAETRCDVTFCVTAPRSVQRSRVLSRAGMSEERFNAIIARQMSDAQKRKLADFVITTGAGLKTTEKRLHKILKRLKLLA